MLLKLFADELNNSTMEHISTLEQRIRAKENNFVIVYAERYNDVQFRGVIIDEQECENHTIIHFNKNGILKNECENPECSYYQKLIEKSFSLRTYWERNGIPAWSYSFENDDIYYESFTVYKTEKKDKIHCIGIVFSLDDLENLR